MDRVSAIFPHCQGYAVDKVRDSRIVGEEEECRVGDHKMRAEAKSTMCVEVSEPFLRSLALKRHVT